jgi:hypothetical protein
MNQSYLRPALVGLALALLPLCACQDTLELTNVPDDSNLELRFRDLDKSINVGDTCRVIGLVTHATGDAAGKGWKVDLSASSGKLDDGGTVGLMVRLETDGTGEVSALFHAPADTGYVVFRLIGGRTIKTDSMKIVAVPPPATPNQ